MARKKPPKRFPALTNNAIVTLVRTHVPLGRPLPPSSESSIAESSIQDANLGRKHWKDLLDVLHNARGCEHVACSRVAEDPETVIFVIIWWDQECLDEFRASPDYAVFLVSLGMLDLSPQPASSFNPHPPSRTIQTVKFLDRPDLGPNHLQGWLSFYTVTLACPVTDTQRERFRRLRGPRYPRSNNEDENMIRFANLPESTRSIGLDHGWVQEPREVVRAGESQMGTGTGLVVQDGLVFRMWLSKEAEEAMKTAIPGLELTWDDDLREIGALEAKEEHVNLVRIARGRDHMEGLSWAKKSIDKR